MNTIIKHIRIFQNIYFVLLILISFVFSSCSEEVDLELDEGFTRLVVDGYISTDTTSHCIQLRTSSSYFFSQTPPVLSGANVEISDGSQTFVLTEKPLGSGNYYTDSTVFGLVGKRYTLSVKNVDLLKDGNKKSFTASEILNPAWQPDSISTNPKVSREGLDGYEILLYGKEAGEHTDFYFWNYYVNGKLGSDTLYKTAFSDDQFFNGLYVEGVPIFNFIEAKEGDTILVETMSISSDFYKFAYSLVIEAMYGGGGIMGPPANVPSNIKQSGLGYFGARAICRNTFIIPKKTQKKAK